MGAGAGGGDGGGMAGIAPAGPPATGGGTGRPGPGTGGVCAAQAIVTRQSVTTAVRAVFEAERVRLTGARWRHAMNDFEDMMLSVERHGDSCKAYAIRNGLAEWGLAGDLAGQLSSDPTRCVALLDTLFELERYQLRVKRLAANAQPARCIGAVVISELQRVANHRALDGFHGVRQ
jgi:hypothetical protein